jgi:hypothetical protein
MHTKTELDETADRGLRRISPDSFVGVAAAIALPLSEAGSVVADQAPTFIAQHVDAIMKTDLRARECAAVKTSGTKVSPIRAILNNDAWCRKWAGSHVYDK